jgi:hypothetical protein
MMTSAFDLDASWSLGATAYAAILHDLRSIDAKVIVEFGSGTSTLRLSRDLPGTRILSVEGDASFLDQTRSGLKEHGGGAKLDLVHRPICWQRHGLGFFRSYEPGSFPEGVDAVLIDGPPLETRRGREACLYQVFPKTHVGTRFYLDDYRREAEQRIVANWLRAYGGALAHRATFEVDHRIAVLERVRDQYRRRVRWRNTADSIVQTTKQLLRR